MEQVVWDEFAENQDRLRSIAAEICAGAEIVRDCEKHGLALDDEFPEGRILTRLHLPRERTPSVVKAAVSQATEERDLRCQICDFDFGARYGALGKQYIERHDVVPLSKMTTRPKADLVWFVRIAIGWFTEPDPG